MLNTMSAGERKQEGKEKKGEADETFKQDGNSQPLIISHVAYFCLGFH